MRNKIDYNYLESIGKRWKKGEHDRIYIKLHEVAKIEKIGENWNDLKINGVDISKTNAWKARAAVATFTTKYPSGFMYYDLKTDVIHFGGNEIEKRIMKEIAKDIRTKILELSK